MDSSVYLGVPYLEGGRDPRVGLDCWGLVRWWYARELWIAIPDLSEAGVRAAWFKRGELPLQILQDGALWQRVTAPRRGDLVVIFSGDKPFHVGVYVGPRNGRREFLQSIKGADSHYASLDDPKWSGRIEGFYRHG